MCFDRYSICMAYWAYMCNWHRGGVTDRDWSRHRLLRNGQMDTIGAQLNRVAFRVAPNASNDPERFEDENARGIYWRLVERYEGADMVPPEWRSILPGQMIVMPHELPVLH